ECGQEQIVGTGPAVRATGLNRLIRNEMMVACRDLLRKPVGVTTNDNDAFRFCHRTPPFRGPARRATLARFRRCPCAPHRPMRSGVASPHRRSCRPAPPAPLERPDVFRAWLL